MTYGVKEWAQRVLEANRDNKACGVAEICEAHNKPISVCPTFLGMETCQECVKALEPPDQWKAHGLLDLYHLSVKHDVVAVNGRARQD